MNVEKIKAGETMLSAQFEQETIKKVDAIVKEESGIFPKKSWLGFKISWESNFLFCTEDLPFMVNDFQAVPAKMLNSSEHKLLDENGQQVTITNIEKGRVLCGRKTILLDGEENTFNQHMYLANGVWVGDDFVEQQVKSTLLVDYPDHAIFPGNQIARAMRILMMKMMGQ